MKFGLLFKPMDPPDAKNIRRRWQETIAAGQLAEQVGFDGLFLPEHHMMADGYPPSPWAALGALAQATERVDVGTTVHLLPFEHPIHTAEHGAMVDVLSSGRLRLGVGMANFPTEFALFGLNPKTQVSRFEEAIDLVQRAWAGEDIDHEGKHFSVKGKISPLPESAELWIGAMSDPGVTRAAKFGCPWPTDPLHNIHVMKHWTDVYRKAGEEFGTSDKLSVVLLRDGWVADSLEEVEKVWWPKIRAEHWFYFEKVPRWVADLEPFVADIKGEEDFVFENHHVDRLIVGSPQDCIEKIKKFEEVLGMDYLVMSFREPHGPSFEEEQKCIERFGRDVISAFR
jgi:alkanesulfonate monooxygenase SsuD/methylene tetrahydromethanopterin reductase-like flavin-dependent oxidoreductase (luciferase family)